MKKTYSTPNIQLHSMNTANAFMAMSAGENNYGINPGANGGNASQNDNPVPDARGNNTGSNKLDLI